MSMQITPLSDGKHRIVVRDGGLPGRQAQWDTAYPLPLIEAIHAEKGRYVCDEIMREEDPRYVEHRIRHEVLGYVEAARFQGKRVLDFGCGAGASSMVLARLLPRCEIVGIELQERLLKLARLRAAYLDRPQVRFMRSPSGSELPDGLGLFDYVVLSAVFEHLLPGERPALLRQIWGLIRPGGILFLNQTPHRYSPVEAHTTGLPLINYLPDPLAHRAACLLSRRIERGADWNRLLRDGIRGATVGEVLRILRGCGSAELAPPRNGDLIDLWHGKLSRRHAWLKKGVRNSLKALKAATGVQLMPELALAIRKEN
jgi:2-polyprenyl-3-methyl-5-hydroxy-6-metoxy-1,4-benzoquinol methylase